MDLRDYGYWALVTSILAFVWMLGTFMVIAVLSWLTNAENPLNDPWLLLSGGVIAIPIAAWSMTAAMNSN